VCKCNSVSEFTLSKVFISVAEPPLAQPDLLHPPKIERLDLEFYDGRVKDLISIYTSDDFGIVNLYLIFRDEQGNLIERGNATEWPDEPNRWGYLTRAAVPSGRSVNVHAAAMDSLGAVGALSQSKTIP